MIHQIQAGVRQVVHVQELPQGLAAPPDGDRGGLVDFRLMELADQGRKYMGILQGEVVIDAVEVAGHDTDIVGAVLTVVEGAHFQSRDFRQGIGFVGLLQIAA